MSSPAISWRGWLRVGLLVVLVVGIAAMHAQLPAAAGAGHTRTTATTMPMPMPMPATEGLVAARPASPPVDHPGHPEHPGGSMCLSTLPQPAAGSTGDLIAFGLVALLGSGRARRPSAAALALRRLSWRPPPPPDLFALGVLRT